MFNTVTPDIILRAIREGLMLVVLVSAPPRLASLTLGFVVGILQATTQIHDQTLAFVPKLFVVALVMLAIGPLLGAQVLRFAQTLLLAIPTIR